VVEEYMSQITPENGMGTDEFVERQLSSRRRLSVEIIFVTA